MLDIRGTLVFEGYFVRAFLIALCAISIEYTLWMILCKVYGNARHTGTLGIRERWAYGNARHTGRTGLSEALLLHFVNNQRHFK